MRISLRSGQVLPDEFDELDPAPPMLGQLGFDVPYVPDGAEPFAGVVVAGFVVVPVVAALAATAPPVTSAPETASTAAALRIGLKMLTPSRAGLLVGFVQ
jgi:hypothetical protein